MTDSGSVVIETWLFSSSMGVRRGNYLPLIVEERENRVYSPEIHLSQCIKIDLLTNDDKTQILVAVIDLLGRGQIPTITTPK